MTAPSWIQTITGSRASGSARDAKTFRQARGRTRAIASAWRKYLGNESRCLPGSLNWTSDVALAAGSETPQLDGSLSGHPSGALPLDHRPRTATCECAALECAGFCSKHQPRLLHPSPRGVLRRLQPRLEISQLPTHPGGRFKKLLVGALIECRLFFGIGTSICGRLHAAKLQDRGGRRRGHDRVGGHPQALRCFDSRAQHRPAGRIDKAVVVVEPPAIRGPTGQARPNGGQFGRRRIDACRVFESDAQDSAGGRHDAFAVEHFALEGGGADGCRQQDKGEQGPVPPRQS